MLWIVSIALVLVLIVMIWRKLAPTVERLHVEGMDESPHSWKRDVLIVALFLLVVLCVIGVTKLW